MAILFYNSLNDLMAIRSLLQQFKRPLLNCCKRGWPSIFYNSLNDLMAILFYNSLNDLMATLFYNSLNDLMRMAILFYNRSFKLL